MSLENQEGSHGQEANILLELLAVPQVILFTRMM
jgi:hypothetical protein